MDTGEPGSTNVQSIADRLDAALKPIFKEHNADSVAVVLGTMLAHEFNSLPDPVARHFLGSFLAINSRKLLHTIDPYVSNGVPA